MSEDTEIRIKALYMRSQIIDNQLSEKGYYQWELGENIDYELRSKLCEDNPFANMTRTMMEMRSLMGYPVKINHKDPDVIKLRMEVKI